MALTRGWVRNAAQTPLDVRIIEQVSWAMQNPGARLTRAGLVNIDFTNDIVMTQATMNLLVRPFFAVLTKGGGDGAVVISNDGNVNVAIGAAPASNSRIDVLYVKHNDDTTGDANALPIFGVAAGVAAASPTKPAIPTGALELATLRVYAGTTATNGGSNLLTNTYPITAVRGAPITLRSLAEMNSWTSPDLGQIVNIINSSGKIVSSYRWDDSTDTWQFCGKTYGYASGSSPRSMTTATQLTMPLALPAAPTVSLIGGITFAASAFTVEEAGIYRISAGILYDAGGGTGRRDTLAFINGAQDNRVFNRLTSTVSSSLNVNFSIDVPLPAGATVDLRGEQTSGGTINGNDRFLSVERIS